MIMTSSNHGLNFFINHKNISRLSIWDYVGDNYHLVLVLIITILNTESLKDINLTSVKTWIDPITVIEIIETNEKLERFTVKYDLFEDEIRENIHEQFEHDRNVTFDKIEG